MKQGANPIVYYKSDRNTFFNTLHYNPYKPNILAVGCADRSIQLFSTRNRKLTSLYSSMNYADGNPTLPTCIETEFEIKDISWNPQNPCNRDYPIIIRCTGSLWYGEWRSDRDLGYSSTVSFLECALCLERYRIKCFTRHIRSRRFAGSPILDPTFRKPTWQLYKKSRWSPQSQEKSRGSRKSIFSWLAPYRSFLRRFVQHPSPSIDGVKWPVCWMGRSEISLISPKVCLRTRLFPVPSKVEIRSWCHE